MSNIVNPLVEEYIRDLVPQNNELLKKMEEYAKLNHVPIVQPEVAKLLEVLTKISKSKSILEVGTAIGYSSIIFCGAMENGSLLTIERRTDMIERANEYIKEAGYEEQIEILLGNAKDILPTIQKEFDMIFLDAAKGQYFDFLNSSYKLLKPGGVLISDNVLYKGMIASDKYAVRRKRTIIKRMRTYLDYIMSHSGFTSCVLPIGDGVAISYKGQEGIR